MKAGGWVVKTMPSTIALISITVNGSSLKDEN